MRMVLRAIGLALALASGAVAAGAGPSAPDAPRQTRSERYGNWGMSCAVATGDMGRAVERCMVSQLVVADPRKRQVVLGLTVDFVDSPAVPTLRARFSAQAEPRAGIGIKVDALPDMRLAITDCDARRCEAVGRLTPPVLKRLRAGKLAQFAYLQKDGRQVTLPLSLKGFGDALAALRQQHQDLARDPARQAAR